MLENGTILIDRYEIISKVGAGGMSDVYKAKDHILGRIVAIKVMKPEFSEDINFVTKFRTEAQSAAGLEHPNIVNVYDVGSENGLHFIVMEHVEGITLKTYVEKKGQLSFKEATSIAIQVARGIETAHNKEIIHRDIKPQNIIISTEGKVKVTDFGIARAISSNTISAEVMGSVHYASPEQARNGYVDGRSDIYSLGIVMYEMVTGRVPFDGDTTVSVAIQHLQEEMVEPSVYAPELPISYEKIILKATQKNPDRRYQTIEELLTDLRKALANPDEDFVVIAPAVVAKTRIIGGEELEEIQNYAENADLDSENVYASQEEEYEEEYDDSYDDYDYDDYDDEEEEKGVLNPKLDKLVNVALIAIAVLIIGIIIWLGASVMNLFNQPGNTQKPPKPSSEVESTQTETGTDKNTETTQKPTEEKELVTMVNIVGWNVKQAEEYLKALGLNLNVIANQESTEPVGTILHQNEAAGNKVEKGKIINVVVSGENESQELKPVPNLVGYTKEIAQALLQAAGFTEPVEVEYGYHEDLTKVGLVVSQTPAAGTRHKETTVIVIVISEGRAPVLVPNNLAEKDLSVAKFKLEDELGFVVVVREEYSENVAKGLVISVQGAGTEVAYGSELEVVISKGKAPASTEDTEDTEDTQKTEISIYETMVGVNVDAADLKETLEDLGLIVVEKTGTDKMEKGKVEDIKVNGQSVVGKKVAVGTTVEIYVGTKEASVKEEVTVPSDLIGKAFDLVKAELEKLGISVSKKEVSSETVESGMVIDIKASEKTVAGQNVQKGSTVEVYVSTGAASPTNENNADETPNTPETNE